MSGTVVGLRNAMVPSEPKSDPEVVEALEKLLEQARAGEITGFAFCLLHVGDLTSWDTEGRQTRGLLGALEMMKYDMIRASLEPN